jgi:UDP-N-acetylmuramate: L-alanyl-gamma-D-glutamyl-meso-diaminopimelate ligase
MKLHFIAIGGAAMHNLAIALKNKGYTITGSDDEVFEPSRSRLEEHGLLPERTGWDTSRITSDLDGVILGMHARKDNPELLRAIEKELKIYSFPEYLFEQTKNKKRVVIAGSHGKTTITAMIIHVLRSCGRNFDFMVGSQIEGFDTMILLDQHNDLAIFEGDEYLSSPLDLRSKFMHYKPHIALVSGIAWDHINVFPTFEKYTDQFKTLAKIIEQNGHFVYFSGDPILESIAEDVRSDIEIHAYTGHNFFIRQNKTFIPGSDDEAIGIELFGKHNLQNLSGAKCICQLLGIDDKNFYKAISTFKGTKKRLQIVRKTDDSVVFLDFAHSPSKVKATVQAVREQYADKKFMAIFELHTYSSLNKSFIPEYKGALNGVDEAIVFFDQAVIEHKKLQKISEKYVKDCFDDNRLTVYSDAKQLSKSLSGLTLKNKVILLMSSGNFGGLDIQSLVSNL